MSEACGHKWRFDGDDPYVICFDCGQMQDALTGRVVRAGAQITPPEAFSADLRAERPQDVSGATTAQNGAEEAAEALALINAAHDEVEALCAGASRGGHTWRMSIPADPKRDSDLIITEALTAAAHLLRGAPGQRDAVTCPVTGCACGLLDDPPLACVRCGAAFHPDLCGPCAAVVNGPGQDAGDEGLRMFAEWVVSLDDDDPASPGRIARRTVTLNDIVQRASRALDPEAKP